MKGFDFWLSIVHLLILGVNIGKRMVVNMNFVDVAVNQMAQLFIFNLIT